MLPQAPEDGEGESWAEIERLARMADDGGADSVWVCDHFLDRTTTARPATTSRSRS